MKKTNDPEKRILDTKISGFHSEKDSLAAVYPVLKCIVVNSMDSRTRLFAFEFRLRYLLSVCPWVSYLTCLRFSVPIYKMGTIVFISRLL